MKWSDLIKNRHFFLEMQIDMCSGDAQSNDPTDASWISLVSGVAYYLVVPQVDGGCVIQAVQPAAHNTNSLIITYSLMP